MCFVYTFGFAGGIYEAVVEQPPIPLHGAAFQRTGCRVPAWNHTRNLRLKHTGTLSCYVLYCVQVPSYNVQTQLFRGVATLHRSHS